MVTKKAERVVLEKPSGEQVEVDLHSLSLLDQAYVLQMASNLQRARAKSPIYRAMQQAKSSL